jgi:hypothetical protein
MTEAETLPFSFFFSTITERTIHYLRFLNIINENIKKNTYETREKQKTVVYEA